jgi:hypothetical protein
MTDLINGWLMFTPPRTSPGVRPYIECADGTKISVQASEFHYCEPRVNEAAHYTSVEISYKGKDYDPHLDHYRDGPDSNVYAYVPVELVSALIIHHGGFK